MKTNIIYNEDCILGMVKNIEDASIDCILTDPPYKYLRNQKLEVDFNEVEFFNQAKRVLKKDGFIVLFGRGTSFYRWNTILADMGFTFKEEIVWDKSRCSSPLMNISRIHETISIFTKGKGTINKVKVPYLEMKEPDYNRKNEMSKIQYHAVIFFEKGNSCFEIMSEMFGFCRTCSSCKPEERVRIPSV